MCGCWQLRFALDAPKHSWGGELFFWGGLVEYHMDVRSENGVPQDPLRLFNKEHEGIGVAYSQSLEFIIASRAPRAPRAPRWKFFGQLASTDWPRCDRRTHAMRPQTLGAPPVQRTNRSWRRTDDVGQRTFFYGQGPGMIFWMCKKD